MSTNIKQLQQMYKRALDMRSPWIKRWDDARRYTMPTSDDDTATLFDSTASDAADKAAEAVNNAQEDKDATEKEKVMAEKMASSYDISDVKYIEPIVAYLLEKDNEKAV